MNKLRVLVLMHESLVPPDSLEGYSESQILEFKTEFDVVHALRKMGHDVLPLGVSDELSPIRRALIEWQPAIAFNLLEEFHGVGVYDHHVVSFLELMRQPYTGCNPRGLLLAHDKSLAKKILAYHRIHTPKFFVVPIGRVTRRPKSIAFPLLVKSVSEEASLGITESSIVEDDVALSKRVAAIHEELRTDALVESYIPGRELYLSICGNRRLTTFPIWELRFTKAAEGQPQIATARVKWDQEYQEQLGVKTEAAKHLGSELEARIVSVCKRVFRALSLNGYARIDMRLTEQGDVYVLEANPNPNLSRGEDFAESARLAGVDYKSLLRRIIRLGLAYPAEWRRV
ncbi:MAG TPA: D-alanine--D-alanine ligase [Pirellulaceae bacterium]|nr:D-alanine--D-alanine ligase [Pirellulaceae bacterium]